MESISPKRFLKFLFIFVCIAASFTYSTSAVRSVRSAIPKTSTDFIRRSCRETTYPRLCFSSLSIHASKIQTSPQLLAATALNVTLSSAKTTSNVMLKLSLSHGLKPKEAAAMKDCVEELSESVDELRKSIGEMSRLKSRSSSKLMINDIQTWVSAALTDENTCSDGFGGKAMNGKVKSVVRVRIVNVAQLTSNALALINRYALING
ncbi:pectinesterase inhibitor 11-like [Morus notabilis]|uniref:pectinesterase inhibitor 11-like n=1 Tax=Morus notabilis TaxID=981085 RepID=UPI000CED0BDA|nr:pectinesterase inhibitor 11-like [Morus notabilis]XP_024018063.1 pectinesterase inhibitor 11-like [Morus notabilis]XP_024032447.1 pectinesterase inhibitor 11-like [Morus notabilis]